MKNFILVAVFLVVSAFGLGANAQTTCFNVVDEYGTHTYCTSYYYSNGEMVYWHPYFSTWIHPRSYWWKGSWHPGRIPGWHAWHHSHR